jgi:hypothetical protein
MCAPCMMVRPAGLPYGTFLELDSISPTLYSLVMNAIDGGAECILFNTNGGSGLDRSELSSCYQCTRLKKGYKPIRIRVISNSGVEVESDNESSTTQCLPCLPTTVTTVKKQKSPDTSEVAAKKLRCELLLEKLVEMKKIDICNQKRS